MDAPGRPIAVRNRPPSGGRRAATERRGMGSEERGGGMKRSYAKLGGQLGLGCVALGLIFIGLGWNGAAGVDFVSGQIPYLLSGGALGLALVAVGVGLIVVQNSRRDRSLLEAQLRELNTSISRL